MKKNLSFPGLIEANIVAKQEIDRTPEPSPVTSDPDSVLEYDRVLETNMTANYAATLDTIYRCRSSHGKNALDLCSGPGHFAILLAKYLGYGDVIGVDLSHPMVELANNNARKYGYTPQVQFHADDVSMLSDFELEKYDLITFSNAAHHMPNLNVIKKILYVSEKLVRPDGIIILSDIGRLKNRQITEDFVELAGREFQDLNMPNMYSDFRNSMFAAWLPEELRRAIPDQTKKTWFQIVPKGFACFQMLVGLPSDREGLYLRQGLDWARAGLIQSEKAKNDWGVMKQIVGEAYCAQLKPSLLKSA